MNMNNVYITNLLNERDTSYNLRGQHLLNVPRVNTTTMGYTLSVIQLVNFGTHYQPQSEPLPRPTLLN